MKFIQRLVNWIRGNEPNHPVFTRTGDRWDKEELIKLRRLAQAWRKNWIEVSHTMKRSPAACKNKYYRLMEEENER